MVTVRAAAAEAAADVDVGDPAEDGVRIAASSTGGGSENDPPDPVGDIAFGDIDPIVIGSKAWAFCSKVDATAPVASPVQKGVVTVVSPAHGWLLWQLDRSSNGGSLLANCTLRICNSSSQQPVITFSCDSERLANGGSRNCSRSGSGARQGAKVVGSRFPAAADGSHASGVPLAMLLAPRSGCPSPCLGLNPHGRVSLQLRISVTKTYREMNGEDLPWDFRCTVDGARVTQWSIIRNF